MTTFVPTFDAGRDDVVGLPQAAGPDWQTSATTRIRCGLGYITNRYHMARSGRVIWQRQAWY